MNRLTFPVILSVACVLFSGYAYADVPHPENTDIVGLVESGTVCFNNDGAVVSSTECDQSPVDEGLAVLNGNWGGGEFSGIKICGDDTVKPVSSAICYVTFSDQEFPCVWSEFILFQNTKNGHFWAIKANADCTDIATPETTGLVPCRKNDSFDQVNGCTPTDNPPQIRVESGYIKLENSNGSPPPASHCADGSHVGRMVVDSVNDLLYICTQSGWITK